MGLETGTRIADLVATNPVGATDFVSQGDDHIRLIKTCLQGSFPNIGPDAVTATGLELSKLSGTDAVSSDFDKLHDVSADAAELNILDGATIDTNELNRLDGVTSGVQAQLDAKQPLDSDLTAIAALTTASYGRDFLTLADNAAFAAKVAAMAQVWTGTHLFAATYLAGTSQKGVQLGGHPSVDAAGVTFINSGAASNAKLWGLAAYNGNLTLFAGKDDWSDSRPAWNAARSGYAITEITYGNTTDLPLHTFNGGVFAPTLTSTANLEYGKLCFTASNGTIPNGVGNQWMLILINGGSPVTFTKPTGSTTYLSNLQVACNTFTVAPHGMCLVIAGGSTLHFVSGDITGYT